MLGTTLTTSSTGARNHYLQGMRELDLARPFDAHGAKHDPELAAVRNKLVGAIKDTITRAFRSSFLLSASLALAAIVVAFVFRRRGVVG